MDNLPEALLFDMDGLLLDTERQFMETLVTLTAPMGMDQRTVEVFFCTLVGTSAAETSAALTGFLPKGVDPVAFEHDWRAANAVARTGGVALRPQVGAVIAELGHIGLPLAVVTSTKRAPALSHLEHAGLLPFFNTVVAGDEVSANKPDPAPYLQAAATLGIDPTRCAAFEDSDIGTRAAVAAGCLTTQIPDLRPDVPLPDLGQRIAPDLRAALEGVGLLRAHDLTA